MQGIDDFRNLLDYNEWANRRAIASVRTSPGPSEKALRALGHLLVAEIAWMKRMRVNEDSTGFDFWPGGSIEACEAVALEASRSYREFLATIGEAGLRSAARYKNSKGVAYETPFGEILTHVMFHSAYHRGQVAMAVRQDGGVPAYSDYIAYQREKG
jgi:uncharacterized damage-inducible protein DinB